MSVLVKNIFLLLRNLISVMGAAVLAALVFSCTDRLDAVMSLAGENRGELEKVLRHYEEEGDSEKLEAARYLILNMPGHRSMTGDFAEYFDEISIALDTVGKGIEDSLRTISERYEGRVGLDFDILRISADYLIADIDRAFQQWREGEWARHLDFDEFCEWLLPYSVTDSHPLSDWRTEYAEYVETQIEHIGKCYDYQDDPRIAASWVNNELIAYRI